ncbi:MAG: alpha/beta hydrolase [Deltaproteobacteria bacterium]|nr:alpha/beta hydrolase [Deltaproteobacteria bacterium]
MPLPTILLLALLAVPLGAADVTITTTDGLGLHAVADVPAEASHGVVLVHGEGRSAADWRFLAQRLSSAGMAVLALDLRGHGTSARAGRALPGDDWTPAVADVQAGLHHLRRKGIQKLALVGADVGANLALAAAVDAPDVQAVVLLSPGLVLHGVPADTAVKAYGARPLLVAVSSEDTYAARSALLLESEALGETHLQIYTGAGRGAAMLTREAGLAGLIQTWVLGTQGGPLSRTRRSPVNTRGQAEEPLETTGPPAP